MNDEIDLNQDLDLGAAFAEIFTNDEATDLGPLEEKKKKEKQEDENAEITVRGTRMTERHFMRRIKSELYLETALTWHFEPGASYHCISNGDVDSLTYLRTIVKQQKIKYMLLSTWCMAITDAEEIFKWLEAGYIHRIDFYVGEIFQGSYGPVYEYIKNHCCINGGRIAVFRNHSKIMAGFGEKFDFAIESSANVNTNPRCENACICCSTDVAKFYKEFYDCIKSFNKDFKDWKPFQLENEAQHEPS